MLQVAETQAQQKVEAWMMDVCKELFETWLEDLSFEEKEVWLWNSLVAMAKIKQRKRA